VGLSEAFVEELRAKYAEMLAMRLAEEAAGSGTSVGADVRARMCALAARFPGALRELDQLELEEIRRRLGRLEAVSSRRDATEPWMEAVALFHQFTRGVLCAKRWLNGRKSVTAGLERAYVVEAASLPFPREALSWHMELAAIARPPEGRVTDLVYARIATVLSISEPEARRRVFGPRAGRRR
jgi:hypothetical protein